MLTHLGIALLRKYYNPLLEHLPTDNFVTLEKFFDIDIVLSNETFSHFMACSSSQECNKEILHFLIESTKNDNQLLGFSFMMQVLTNNCNVTILFRDGEYHTIENALNIASCVCSY